MKILNTLNARKKAKTNIKLLNLFLLTFFVTEKKTKIPSVQSMRRLKV